MSFLQKLTVWAIVQKEAITAGIGLLASVFALTANAQGINTGITPLSNAAGATVLLCNVMNVMFWVLISVSIIMFMWGAYLYVFAGEDLKRASEARMTILYAAIGVVIALCAKGFPLVVASIFPNASVFGCGQINGTTSSVSY